MNGVEYMLRDRSPRYSVAIHICHYKLDGMTNTLLNDLLLQKPIDGEVGVFLFDNGSPVPYSDGPIPAKTIYRVQRERSPLAGREGLGPALAADQRRAPALP